jgi:hypothetical protein
MVALVAQPDCLHDGWLAALPGRVPASPVRALAIQAGFAVIAFQTSRSALICVSHAKRVEKGRMLDVAALAIYVAVVSMMASLLSGCSA